MGVVMNEQPGERTKKFEISTKYQRYILTEDVLICSLTGPFPTLSTDLTKTWSVLGNGFRGGGGGNASSRDGFGLRVSG